jgi:dipeptidyl aminopeptidase/acylaminoacyl peptidase
MSAQTIAPYGTWDSPVTTAALTSRPLSLGGLSADSDTLYWLESRPSEAGRTALVRWSRERGTEEVTPAPANLLGRFYEYGGGVYRASGGWIVYSEHRDSAVRLIAPDGTVRVIAQVPGCRYADFWFDWKRWRVLALREDQRRRPQDPEIAIVALALDPGEAGAGEVLVRGPDFLAAPRLSPDGSQLAWLEWDHPNMPWDGTRLRLAELDAQGRPIASIVVAGGETESIVQPLFVPDGTLHFSSDRSGWWNLHAWREGTVQPLAPVAGEIGGPDWLLALRYYSILDDGRILAVLIQDGIKRGILIAEGKITPLGLGQIQGNPVPIGDGFAYILAPPDQPLAIRYREDIAGEDRVIALSAPPLLNAADISIGRPIRFTTSDGTTAHAFFYAPCNAGFAAPAGELPPLIVLCHGGPTSMATNALSLAIQWWTTRGFAVVDVNYGGSTGFGRAYRHRLDGRWGVVDVEDCIAAARHLAESGLVDPGRIAISGGSAGGFTVLSALAASPVFKAGASHFGIADPMQFRRETHKFEARYLDRLIGRPDDELYRRRSPLARAGRITAPVIFFQGLDDRIVPPSVTDTMVEAMCERGLPVAQYCFAGEGHGFRTAETIRRVLDLELSFYGSVFGFTPPGIAESVVLCEPAQEARLCEAADD